MTLIVDVCVAGRRVARRVVDAWNEKDHPRKGGKFVKKGEGVGAANELHEKHGVTGDHVIEGASHAGHGMTVRAYVKQHGPKAAQQLLDALGTLKLNVPAAGSAEPQFTVHDPRAKSTVFTGTLKDIKKQGIYVWSKHAVAADILGSARLGGGATNNKGEHKGKTYVLRAHGAAAEAAGGEQVAAPAAAHAPAQTPPAATAGGPPDASSWKQVGPQMGSNPGGVYADADGAKHYVKQLKSVHHVESETLANALYEKLGVHTSKPQHVKLHGKDAIASKMQTLTKFDAANEHHLAEAQRHFAAHAFLANYDATGLHQDNHAFVDGKYATVDAGGSLKYRAQGALKTKFDGSVDELDTMRDAAKNAASHSVFGDMSPHEIAESAKVVTALKDEDIASLVNEHMKSASSVDRMLMRKTLISRRDDIKKRVAAMQSKQSKYDPTPTAPKAPEYHAGPAAAPTTPVLSSGSKSKTKALLVKSLSEALSSGMSTQKSDEAQHHVKNEHGDVIASGSADENWKNHGISYGGKHKTEAKIFGEANLQPEFHLGDYAGKKLTLHAGAAPLTPKFHVKTPLTSTLVAQGTIAELNAQGISASENQIAGALQSGSHHLNSSFHSGEHKGQKYVLHKGEYKPPELDVPVAKISASESPYDPTPGSDGYASSDEFERPEKSTIKTDAYLAHSKKQHDVVMPQQITEEHKALQKYTGWGYSDMNKYLRGGGKPAYGVMKHIEPLQKLAQRSKLQDDHVLWRGIKDNDAKKYLSVLQPGEHYVDPGFMSTSHNKSTAESFAGWGSELMVIRARKGASGIHVGDLGGHTNEHEVVLPHGTQLRYAGRSKEGHYVFDHHT